MQIIAGKFKGHKILAPKGTETRPTSGRLRETVFNILQNHIEDAHFLDLFAGSGAMGIEALSRGAAKATFVEQDRTSYRTIEKNIEKLDLKCASTILCEEALKALSFFHKTGQKFDLIFLDPPYADLSTLSQDGQPLSAQAVKALDHYDLLNQGGLLLVEESKFVDLETLALHHLTFKKKRNAGKTALTEFFKAG